MILLNTEGEEKKSSPDFLNKPAADPELHNSGEVKDYPMKKKILFTAVIFCFFIVLCLGIEGLTRLLGGKPFPNIQYADSDYEVEWELKKNFDDDTWLTRTNYDGSKTKIRITTNSFGLRDDEIPAEKPSDEYRILFLGDSVVFGFMLNKDETLPAALEKYLAPEIPGKKVNVLNCGVDGYSTFQEYYFLKKRGLTLEPDMVITGFVLNDIFEPHLVSKARGGRGSYAGIAGSKNLIRSASRLALKSAFFTTVFSKYQSFKHNLRSKKTDADGRKYRSADSKYNTESLFAEPVSPEIEAAWKEVENDLLDLKKITEEKKIPLVIVVFPYAAQVVTKKWNFAPQKRLAEFCEKNNIILIDLAEDFLAAPHSDLLYIKDDGNHFSPEGSEFISKILSKKIDKLILEQK